MNVLPWHEGLWHRLTADRDRLPHALLLHGPRGIGKKQFARALGQWLLCEHPAGEGACGRCASCGWLEQDAHPDFTWIEPAAEGGLDDEPAGRDEAAPKEAKGKKEGAAKKGGKHITINEIREMGEHLALSSHQGGWRVVVIHPAETMNPAAANALLKTLEEPPSRVVLMLIAHQPRRLLPTVLSRCRKIEFTAPPRVQATEWLVAQGREDAAAMLDEMGGAPLLALDSASPERRERRRQFLRALAKPSPAVLSALAQEQQSRLEESWGWLNRWLFDLQLVRAAGRARYFPEAGEVLSRLARRADEARLWALHAELIRSGRWLRHTLNGQLLLESWLLGYLEAMEAGHGG